MYLQAQVLLIPIPPENVGIGPMLVSMPVLDIALWLSITIRFQNDWEVNKTLVA